MEADDTSFSIQEQIQCFKSIIATKLGLRLDGIIYNDVLRHYAEHYYDEEKTRRFIQALQKVVSSDLEKGQLRVDSMISMGRKIQRLFNEVYFTNEFQTKCLNYISRAKPNKDTQNAKSQGHFSDLKFDLSTSDSLIMFKNVNALCKQNMQAFGIVPVYYAECLKRLNQNKEIQEIQKILEKNLQSIEKQYPPTPNKINDQIIISASKLMAPKIKTQASIKLNKGSNQNLQKIRQFVIEKAQKARPDLTNFDFLVKSICLARGYGFKSSLKVRSQKHESAINRVLQKLLEETSKETNQKKFKYIPQKKEKLNGLEKIQDIYKQQKRFIEDQRKQCLKSKQQLDFNISDLVRGKYWTITVLVQAVNRHNYFVVGFKNRLHKGTQDFVIKIQLQNCVAELQLCLSSDSNKFEFNHKIYELMRPGDTWTLISNVMVHKERWSLPLLFELKQMSQHMSNIPSETIKKNFSKQINFKELLSSTELFIEKFKVQISQLQSRKGKHSEKQISLKNLTQKVKQLQRPNIEISEFKRLILTVNFYEGKNNKEALKIHRNIEESFHFKEEQDEYVYYFHRGIGDVYHSITSEHEKAVEHLEEAVKVAEMRKGKECYEVGSTLNTLGMIHRKKGEYEKAIANYERAYSIIIKQNNGVESLQTATNLNNIGIAYERQGEYPKAIQYDEKASKVYVTIQGSERLNVAMSLMNIGISYKNLKQYKEALAFYQRSLSIKETLTGKESQETAITLFNMANTLDYLGEYKEAYEKVKRSYEIWKKVMGEEHEDTKNSEELMKFVSQKV